MPRSTAPRPTSTRSKAIKGEIIQIRVSAEAKAVLYQAAALREQKLSEFMLDSARSRAEEAILDQRLFLLEPRAYAEFLAMLDRPTAPNGTLRTRLRRKPNWER